MISVISVANTAAVVNVCAF